MLTMERMQQILGEVERTDVDPQKIIADVTADSRTVVPGSVFFALTGQKVDGARFISQAISAGAEAIIADRKTDRSIAVPLFVTERARHFLGILAAECHGNPSRDLDLVGITGTNGKTTTSYFLRQICNNAGQKCELIGTTGYTLNRDLVKLDHTTPEAPTIQHLIATFRQAGARTCVMEVSSHAIAFERIAGCRFRGGIFTNISDREHLDFHKNFTHYLETKMAFFSDYIATGSGAFACLNADDQHLSHFQNAAGRQVTLFSLKGAANADVSAHSIRPDLTGVSFQLALHGRSVPARIRLPGPYNVQNALAASAAALNLGFTPEQIVAGLESLKIVPGRFELIDEGQDFALVVDFAHTADALINLLTAARECRPARLITVFGCGGDRDTSKRPHMGKIAAELSDLVLVTSDNPRSEKPQDIIGQIQAGITTMTNVMTIPDRAEAIHTALTLAQPGDMVIIAGKGHEDYQILGQKTIHFSDQEQARHALKKLVKN